MAKTLARDGPSTGPETLDDMAPSRGRGRAHGGLRVLFRLLSTRCPMKRLNLLAYLLGFALASCGPPATKPFGDMGDTGGSAAGGTVGTGGATTGTGGETGATGGVMGSGGTGTGGNAGTPSGGHASGGGGSAGSSPHTGGTGSGGVSTGGAPAGGSGGARTGGSSTGGNPAGGAATGGLATGGLATGGLATGGLATGGANTGGAASGGTGGGGPTCESLASDYQTAVSNAKSCTTTGTCGYSISKTICGCQGCPATTFVSDTSGPDKVTAQWKALGCSCPKTLCVLCRDEPTSATCSSVLTTAAAPIGGGGTIILPRSCQDQSGTAVTQ
jgi:hypothetical protein